MDSPSSERPEPATPEGNSALRVRIEELLGTYAQVRRNLDAMQQRLREAQGEARSDDGSIRLRVGPQGNLLDLQLEPRAYRRLSPTELAQEILKLCRKATGEVQGEMEKVMAPFLPKGTAYADVLAGRVDPASWAPPQPLNSENFDSWWAGIGRQAGASDAEG